jgi:hypothetical protein
MADWEDETICRVMRVTLDRVRAQTDTEYIFLPSVLEDLTDAGQGTPFPFLCLIYCPPIFCPCLHSCNFEVMLTLEEPRLSVVSLEPAIISRTMADESQTPFHYLLGAWRRAGEVTRTIRMDRDPNAQDKLKVLAEIKRLCVSYAGLSLMMPDMFGSVPSAPNFRHRSTRTLGLIG